MAKCLLNHDPAEVQWSISLAYATRRAESIEAAKVILLEAVERHPKEPILHYNLTCYECQLGEVEVAKPGSATLSNWTTDAIDGAGG